jgi:hypothetical protein
VCARAERDYRRAYRAKARGLDLLPDNPRVSKALETSPDGPVTAATLAELESLSASVSRPGLAAGIVAMAQLLDDKRLATTHPSAARQLAQGLDRMRNASHVAKGRLASVAALSPGKLS